MANYIICFCLLRIVLPVCIVSSIIIRPVGFSFIYLLFLFYLPFVPVPTQKTFKGHSGHYLRCVLVISIITLTCQLVWHILLASIPDEWFDNWLEPVCQTIEAALRHAGLVNFYNLDAIMVCKWISPEIIMFFSSTIIYIMTSKLCKGLPDDELQSSSPKRKSGFLVNFGKYACLFMLMIAGSLRPSILSGIYYITFLWGATWWACGKELAREFAIVCKCIMAIIFCHIVILFVYQSQWILELLPPDHQISRLLGFTQLISMNCTTDPRELIYLPLEWASFVSPVFLLLTYYLLAFESSALLKPQPEKKTGNFSKLESGNVNGSIRRQMSMRLSRTRMGRGNLAQDKWRTATRKVRLMRTVSPSKRNPSRKSNASSSAYFQDSTGSVIVAPEEGLVESMDHEDEKPTIIEHVIDTVTSIFHLLRRSSYIATAIIMMAWSITFHSWLAFILLIWANIIWMVENKRGFTLGSSPFLVIYAQILLLAQYIYGMDLTEDELPSKIEDMNMAQIGFERPQSLPCLPILAKSLFTIMFWVTLRQFIQDRVEKLQSIVIQDMAAPLQVTVGAAAPGIDDEMNMQSPLMKKVGDFVKGFFTKYWICVVVIMLFAIGITGTRITVFRIIYMGLFLIFILTFQMSIAVWRKMMYGFLVTVIIYSMLILVLIYTYQFDNFPMYWQKYLKISPTLQLDIGLETYKTKDLFLRLISPTAFLIITVIQLHYFHKDFLEISNMKQRSSSITRQDSQGPLSMASSMMGGSTLPPSTPHERQFPDIPENGSEIRAGDHSILQQQSSIITQTHTVRSTSFTTWLVQMRIKLFSFLQVLIDLFFLFLELHLVKIVLLSIMLLCVFDACALHVGFVFLVSICMLCKTKFQLFVIKFVSIVTSILMLLKMVYQIEYIVHDSYAVNCTFQNSSSSSNSSIGEVTYNNAEWVGFKKTNINITLAKLLKGYIGLIILFTFKSMVDFRQDFKRYAANNVSHKPRLMFPNITRLDADKNLKCFFQFLFNFGFYKFGVEICLMCLVGLIGSRMDAWAVLYGFWLCALWRADRDRLMRLWGWFLGFIVTVIPIQYLMVVGIIPELCVSYPWMGSNEILQRTRDWFMLPDPTHRPYAAKIMCDFILLMFCSRQALIFRIEQRYGETFKGGSNSDKIPDWEVPGFINPVPDFVTYIRSWLDVVKRITMLGSLWVTLAIMFLTGTNRVNLFSLGYLIGSFIFLWQGTNIYLRPIKSTLKWWNWLLGYNVSVIVIKAVLQIFGCIFIRFMQSNACWLVQLLGIGCIDKFSGGSIKTFFKMMRPDDDDHECSVPREDIGLAWDGVCFGFLLMQRRLFHSHYFLRIIEESKAITILQSRGAELIEELRQKQMRIQEEQEKKILFKIKVKMDRIKANQQKQQGPAFKEPDSHFAEDVSEIKGSILLKRSGSNVSECCISIQTPAGGYHTPRTPTTPGSPRGYHTPISEEGSPEHQRSPPGPPSPFSALMTVSLDAYLEPQRISFGSPPSSELNPRVPSPSESYPVFSPPPPRRRRRSSQSGTQWMMPAPVATHTPRHSVISFSGRSQLSHHTYSNKSGRSYHLKHPTRPNKYAIRSGDYYMFEEFDDDDELEIIGIKEQESDDGIDDKLTLGQLLSSAMKTDIGQATQMRRGSVPPVPMRRNRLSTRSLRQSIITDSDKVHSTEIDGEEKKDDDPHSEHSDHPIDYMRSYSEIFVEETLWDKICKYVAFGWAFIESILVSLTRWLYKFSRDYRYVAKVLVKEKILLKEKDDFGIGIRAGKSQIWEPLPSTLMKLKKPQDSDATDVICDQQKVETSVHATRFKERRKESMLSVPEIRILAPSMERGLDLDSPKPSPTFKPIRHSSVYSIPTSSESTTPIEEYDDEMFAADQPTVFRFLFAVWYAIIAHTDIVCYFMIFINQIQSATILSLPLPLMVFLWGTLTIPRPSKTFWITIIAYTEIIVLLKSMLQYEILPWNQNVIPDNLPFSAPRIIGIERKHNYALYDLILLLLVFFHRFMLISLGLWKSASPEEIKEGVYSMNPKQIEQLKNVRGFNIGQLFLRKQTEKDNPEKDEESKKIIDENPAEDETKSPLSDESQQHFATPKASQSSRDIDEDDSNESTQTKSTEKNLTILSQKVRSSDIQLETIVPKPEIEQSLETLTKISIEEERYKFPQMIKMSTMRYCRPVKDFYSRMIDPTSRVKADVYAYMFMCDFFNFMVVIFGFSAFGTQQGDGGVQAYLEDNKVPIPFLVMLILQFGLIVIDRALFLRKFILGKLLFQICLTFGVHIWMFFILPAVTERRFNALLPPPLWYMVKCVYLLLSAYQIRCGYPTRILGNFLCKGYNYMNMYLFKGFMAVPFLFELRTLMDWIWTDTSMNLMDWLKMEDIFANIFQLKCSRHVESEYPQPRGEKKNPWKKYLIGGSVLALVIAIIWFPLVLFAFGNTVGESNPPYDVTVNIRIGPYLPIYSMSAQSNNILLFNEEQWNTLSSTYKKDRTAQTFLSNYVYDDLASVILNGNSTSVWAISPPDMERLRLDAASNSSLNIRFSYEISHKSNTKENPTLITEEIDVEIKPFIKGKRNPQRDLLVNMLSSNSSEWLLIENIFPKFVKVFNKGTAKAVKQLMEQDSDGEDEMYRNISLKLTHGIGTDSDMWWEVREHCGDYNYLKYLSHIPFVDCDQLIMYTFNDKLFPATLNFISGSGIIGLYTTFVFVASRLLRSNFADICFKIMFDDLPNVDRVLQLCFDIYLVRESGELALEEDLFAKLVFLYRSPETMIKWTRPKEDEEPEDEEHQGPQN